MAYLFATGLTIIATILRPEYKISKIYATPSWVLYCAAICVLLFSVLYRLIDAPKNPQSEFQSKIPMNCKTTFQEPSSAPVSGKFSGLLAAVAANPLIAYLIPFVVFTAYNYCNGKCL